jgi:hypothetical protein
MYATIAHHGAKLFALTIITVAIASCGGGTTGTSSTDSVKFAGYAEQPNGGRAPFLSMTVSSGISGEDLESSGTNADGDFAMALPSSESSLVVDVVGVGSTTMRRQQEGPGTLSAKLSDTGDGLVSGLQFEAQVTEENLCPILSVSGDELVVIGDDAQIPCLATIAIASQELTLRNFEGSVVARCSGAITTLTTARSSADGKLTLDLSEAINRECDEIRIVLTNPQAPGLESIFYVK